MTVLYEKECKANFDFEEKELLETIIAYVLEQEQCPYEAEVSVTLVSREEIHRINKEFRQVDRPTDVLSFPMMEYDAPADFDGELFCRTRTLSPESGELVLGDIVLCSDVIKEQAKEYGHSELREFSFLTVHSMLHLLGYDHMEEEERAFMEERQRVLMRGLNISR